MNGREAERSVREDGSWELQNLSREIQKNGGNSEGGESLYVGESGALPDLSALNLSGLTLA